MPATGKTRRWFYPVFFCLPGIFLGVASEAVVRLFWSPAHPRWPRTRTLDPDVGLVHLPGKYHLPFKACAREPNGCNDLFDDFTANRQGFRSTRDFDNPSDRPLVAVLGDSMVEAVQVSDDRTACSLLEQQLRSRFPNAEVRNYGMLGAGFVHYYARWKKFVRSTRPDVLVIATFAYNDFKNSSTSTEGFPPMWPHFRTTRDGERQIHFEPSDLPGLASYSDLARFWYWLRWMREDRDRMAQGAPDMEVYRIPPRDDFREAISTGTEYLAQTIREAKESGVQVIVVLIPWSGEIIQRDWDKWISRLDRSSATYSRNRAEELVREAASQSAARLVSMSDSLKGLQESDQYRIWNWGNDSHFTEEGNRKLAECILPPVSEILESKNP